MATRGHATFLMIRQAPLDDLLALLAVLVVSVAYASKGMLWSKPDPYSYKLFEKPQKSHGFPARLQLTRDVAERLEISAADVVILWASQSGTAERFATRLARNLTRQLGAKTLAIDISDIDPISCSRIPQSKIAIFIASTFGEGDPSDNLYEFWNWLSQKSSEKLLSSLRYLAFGLGNSAYVHYNLVIDTIDQRLRSRGAELLLPVGKADDVAGETEEHFLEWQSKILALFETRLGYTYRDKGWEPSLSVVFDESLAPIALHRGIPYATRKASSTQSRDYTLPVEKAIELCARGDRSCIHMEIGLPQPDLKYRTGDHIGIWPINPSEDANALIEILGVTEVRATPCHIKSLTGEPLHLPTPTTIQALFEHYLEIAGPLTRDQIASLSAFAPDSAAKAFLEVISRDKASYASYLNTDYLTLARLLKLTRSADRAWSRLPLSFVIELLRPMQPRYYSISSAASVQPRRVALTAVVANTPVGLNGEHAPGLATNYLSSFKHDENATSPRLYAQPELSQPLQGSYVHAHIRKSSFKLPTMSTAPVLMVGAGTGVAPFRAFVQERARQKSMGRDMGPTKLFLGCRNLQVDFIYREEFDCLYSTLGSESSMEVAFSRPSDGSKKQYVQHRILQAADEVCELLVEKNTYFYICGSAAMARDVLGTISEILMVKRGWSDARVKEFCDQQKRQKRWMQDVWG